MSLRSSGSPVKDTILFTAHTIQQNVCKHFENNNTYERCVSYRVTDQSPSTSKITDNSRQFHSPSSDIHRQGSCNMQAMFTILPPIGFHFTGPFSTGYYWSV